MSYNRIVKAGYNKNNHSVCVWTDGVNYLVQVKDMGGFVVYAKQYTSRDDAEKKYTQLVE